MPQHAVRIGAAVAFVVILIVVAALVLRPGSPGGSVASPTPTGTPTPAGQAPRPTETPTATATPASLSPREQAEAFALEPVEGAIERVRIDAGETPTDNPGTYFMDVASGAIEGWRADGMQPGAVSDDHRFATFSQRQPVAGGVPRSTTLLADRETGAVYRWEGDAEIVHAERSPTQQRLATRGDRVLFRIDDPEGDDWFVVVTMDPEPVVASTVRVEGWIALFADDGRRLAVMGEALWLAEVESGAVEGVDAPLPDALDLEGGLSLRNTGGGAAFLLTVTPAKEDFEGAWLRADWRGAVQRSGQGAFSVYPSGNGEFVATVKPLLDDAERWPVLTVFTAVRTADGADLFRVVGAVESFGFTTGDIWLADGSGIVLSNASLEVGVATRDGGFRSFAGMPSPTDSTRFATASPVDGGPRVVDAAGNVIAGVEAGARSFLAPWGTEGTEMRFFTPHLGHGGIGFVRSLVVPRMEQPPYADAVSLSLAGAAVGRELLDAPATGSVMGTLNTTVVTVIDETWHTSFDAGDPGYERYCDLFNELVSRGVPDCTGPLWGQWVLIEAQPDQRGWLLIAVHPEGL